jgi:phosphotransferase system, enzyme I, PtsP
MALIGIGLKRLSITPAAIGAVKAMVRTLDSKSIAEEMDRLLAVPPESIRASLTQWAKENDVEI